MADNLGPMAWLFLPENVQVQYLQKIALRAENPSGSKYNNNATDSFNGFLYSPKGAKRIQTGVLTPGDGYPNTGKPWKGDKMVFRAFSTRFVGVWYNGGLHPRLLSWQPFRLRAVSN